MAVICNQTTWVPYFSLVASTCHQLRELYFQYGMTGAGGAGLGGRNCAAIFYRRPGNAQLCHVTNSSVSNVGTSQHSEAACIEDLKIREGITSLRNPTGNIQPPLIQFVYTERFPCGSDNANCMDRLNREMPDGTVVFWSFDYPDSTDLQMTGEKRKRSGDDDRDEAKKRRKAGTKDLQDYQRDIDFRGSTTQNGSSGGLVISDLGSRIEGIVNHYQQTGSLPNPMPSDFD